MVEIAILLVLWGYPPVTVDRFRTMVECEKARLGYQAADKQRAELYRCIEGMEL